MLRLYLGNVKHENILSEINNSIFHAWIEGSPEKESQTLKTLKPPRPSGLT